MKLRDNRFAFAAVLAGSLLAMQAHAQTSVSFGRITDVRQVEVQDDGARAAGTLVGGALGVASGGSGRSSSNRALRGIGGATVGNRMAGAMSRSTAFEYTVLIDGASTRIVTDQAGLRVGDCVALERGSFNNLRLAPEERCDVAGATASAAEREESDACIAAKQQLIDASTDADFERAERRMRLLCDH